MAQWELTLRIPAGTFGPAQPPWGLGHKQGSFTAASVPRGSERRGGACPRRLRGDPQAAAARGVPAPGRPPLGRPEGPLRSSREGVLFRQSPYEARPSRRRKKPLPGATVTSGFRSLAAGKAMSKGRAEAATGAPGILLKYLQEQNRPYSAQDVFGNLQREHGLGKAAVVKALEQLAQQGKIKEKMYGKQKIYFADQDQFDTVNDADLQSLDAKIVTLTAKVQSLQQSCRQMEAELKELSSALTTPEMQKEIQELKKECAGYTERLKNIKAATNHVTPEEKEQVHREKQRYCKEWRKRKRMATELCDAILEGYPKSKKQFFEEVGIETDEDYNVKLPDP